MKFLLVLVSLAISSCSTADTDVLYDIFSEYRNRTNTENILERHVHYFSPRLVEGEEPDTSTIPLLLFYQKMAKEGEHYTSMKDASSGCLTIDGYDNENGEPIEFNIQYVKIKQQWYMDGIHVRFLDNPSEFSRAAICPSEVIN